MIIFSDGTTVVLKFVESYSSGFGGQTFTIRMYSGANITITDKKDIEAFKTAMRKLYKEDGITDLSK